MTNRLGLRGESRDGWMDMDVLNILVVELRDLSNRLVIKNKERQWQG